MIQARGRTVAVIAAAVTAACVAAPAAAQRVEVDSDPVIRADIQALGGPAALGTQASRTPEAARLFVHLLLRGEMYRDLADYAAEIGIEYGERAAESEGWDDRPEAAYQHGRSLLEAGREAEAAEILRSVASDSDASAALKGRASAWARVAAGGSSGWRTGYHRWMRGEEVAAPASCTDGDSCRLFAAVVTGDATTANAVADAIRRSQEPSFTSVDGFGYEDPMRFRLLAAADDLLFAELTGSAAFDVPAARPLRARALVDLRDHSTAAALIGSIDGAASEAGRIAWYRSGSSSEAEQSWAGSSNADLQPFLTLDAQVETGATPLDSASVLSLDDRRESRSDVWNVVFSKAVLARALMELEMPEQVARSVEAAWLNPRSETAPGVWEVLASRAAFQRGQVAYVDARLLLQRVSERHPVASTLYALLDRVSAYDSSIGRVRSR